MEQNVVSLIVIGQLSVVLLVIAIKRPHNQTSILAALLILSIMSYVGVSNELGAEFFSPVWPVFLALSLLPAYCLWLFALNLFEVSSPRADLRWWVLSIPLLVFTIASLASNLRWVELAYTGHRVAALVLLIDLAYRIVLEHKDDLVVKRRWFRVWFVALIALQAGAILIVELAYGDVQVPEVLEVINVGVIGLLVVFLTLPLLAIDQELLSPGETSPSGDHLSDKVASQSKPSQLVGQLFSLMESGYYVTSGLTIPQLAERLGTTEHTLRATINQELGYRNFSAFLNSYRIKAAKERLRAAEWANSPILTIALELGYASIGPFNRAFKADVGMTPSEFRRID